MRLLFAYVKAGTFELVRYPAYSVPTVAFPTLLFVLFALPSADADPAVVTAAFAAIAVLGVTFFQFGVGIALERASPWEAYLRTLPATTRVRFGARLVSALAFAATSVSVLLATALATTSLTLPPGRWAAFAAVLLLGSVPFALLGIALGYWARPKAALPLANLLFLPLSFLGGLWGGASHLPDAVEHISPLLPTRQWGDLLWAATARTPFRLSAVAGLTVYAVVFGLLAVWGYRRDEGERYR